MRKFFEGFRSKPNEEGKAKEANPFEPPRKDVETKEAQEARIMERKAKDVVDQCLALDPPITQEKFLEFVKDQEDSKGEEGGIKVKYGKALFPIYMKVLADLPVSDANHDLLTEAVKREFENRVNQPVE